MTEAEWLACEDPQQMLEFCRDKLSNRKARLVIIELARRESSDWGANALRSIALGERWADGVASDEEVREFSEETDARWYCLSPEPIELLVGRVEEERVADEYEGPFWTHAIPFLLCDIFGNPFRPVAFSPEWRTDTALSLARTMYESREFSAMPILADALQDAGCDNEDILTHCRSEGPPRTWLLGGRSRVGQKRRLTRIGRPYTI